MAALLVLESFLWLWLAGVLARVWGWSAWTAPAVAAFGYLALRLALVLVSFAIARRIRGAPWPALSPVGWIGCVAEEWVAVVHHHLLLLPFHWLLPGRRPRARPGAVPVLFLHGLWNNAGVWRPLLARLAAAGRTDLYTVTYGPPWLSIDGFADKIAVEVERVCAQTRSPRLVIVGHSMGGLVARAYLRRHGARRVAKLITLGAPHRGSKLAHLAAGACGRELRPASEWFTAWEALPPPEVPCTSVYSLHDNLVSPQDSAELPGAKWIALPGIGHNALNYAIAVAGAVLTELGEAAMESARARAPATTSGFPG